MHQSPQPAACKEFDVICISTDNSVASSSIFIDSIALPVGVPIIVVEEKKKFTVEDLLAAFARLSGSKFFNDRALLNGFRSRTVFHQAVRDFSLYSVILSEQPWLL